VSDQLIQHQRIVNGSALVAALFVVGRTALLGVVEPLPWMAEVGEVLYDLGLAWVTAWAFQLLVIVIPAERERQQFDELLAPRLDHLIVLGMQLADVVAQQLGREPGPLVDGTSINKVCTGVSLKADAPGWASNWGGVLRHIAGRAEHIRANLRPFYPRLPPELLQALEEEEQAMDEIARMERLGRAFNSPDMKRLEGPLFRWLTSIEMVRDVRARLVAANRPLPKRSVLDAGMLHVPVDDFIRQREDLARLFKTD
jgi:hypothetical protein